MQAVEQKKEQSQAPAFTVQMGEAGFSLNVKMLDPNGQEVMLTFRAPLASHSSKLIEHYQAQIAWLIDAGWQPLKAGARPAPGSGAPAAASEGGAPTCRVHGTAMKPSRRPGSFFCSKKLADGSYCSEKVDA